MVDRQVTDTVDTAEEDSTVVSKIGGRFCAATGKMTLGGRIEMKSKAGFHRIGGRNYVAHRSVGSMVVR